MTVFLSILIKRHNLKIFGLLIFVYSFHRKKQSEHGDASKTKSIFKFKILDKKQKIFNLILGLSLQMSVMPWKVNK